jgi:tetratricopeptide (TPR) repeat protein
MLVLLLVVSAQAPSSAACVALTRNLTAAPRAEMVTQKLADKTVAACRADKANKSSEPYRLAALFYVEHNELAKAVKLFDEALRVEPKRDLVRSELALALVSQEKLDEALEQARRITASKDDTARLNANNAAGLALFQKYYESQGEPWTHAEPYFLEVLKQKPDDAKTCYFIGILERYGKHDAAAGSGYLRKACDGGYEQACGEALK